MTGDTSDDGTEQLLQEWRSRYKDATHAGVTTTLGNAMKSVKLARRDGSYTWEDALRDCRRSVTAARSEASREIATVLVDELEELVEQSLYTATEHPETTKGLCDE